MEKQQELVVPLVEERVSVARREVETGRVRVTTRVEAHDQLVREELAREEVQVERIARNQIVEAMPDVRVDGDLTIIPVVEEILVVEKRLVLVEEIHLRRVRRTDEVSQTVTVLRQKAEIDRGK